jgi:hypothetical protein
MHHAGILFCVHFVTKKYKKYINNQIWEFNLNFQIRV